MEKDVGKDVVTTVWHELSPLPKLSDKFLCFLVRVAPVPELGALTSTLWT